MQTTQLKSSLAGSAVRPTQRVARQQRVSRTVAAVQDGHRGPSKGAMGLFGALAAVQIALLPVSGPALAGPLDSLLPKSATSQSARDDLNRKTSGLPSLKETGKDLVGGGDPIGAGSAKDIGKKIDQNTPNVDLKSNPKDLAQKAAGKASNAVSDLSAVFDLAESPTNIGDNIRSDERQSPNKETPELSGVANARAPNNDIGPMPTGNLPSPDARQNLAPPSDKVSSQSPGADVGVSDVGDIKSGLDKLNPFK